MSVFLKITFAFVPADKATNDVALMCCKYYMEFLQKKMVNSPTYKPCMHSTEPLIVDRRITSTDKLKAPAKHFRVTIMYWLPKIHIIVGGDENN